VRILFRCTVVLALAGFGAWAQSPPPVILDVLNATMLDKGPLAPGMWVTVIGTNLASSYQGREGFPFPVALNGVSVLINGKAAPLDSVSATEIQLQVPFEISGTSATIQVTSQAAGQTLRSAVVTVGVAPEAPQLYTSGDLPPGFGAFFAVSSWPITLSSPARPGDTVTAYGDGFGVTNPAVPNGADPESYAPVVAKVTVTVGGKNATVLGAYFKSPGWYGVDLVLPGDLPAGDLVVVATVGGVSANPVLIPVSLTPPPMTIARVSNDASGGPAVASGSWVSITGTNLASAWQLWQPSDFSGNNLPLEVGGVSVTVNGKAAAVYSIDPGQIVIQAPADTATGEVPVVVTNRSSGTASGTVTLAACAPGFFAISGKVPYVGAVHVDQTPVAPVDYFPGYPSRPAKPGEIVQMWGTGFGSTIPAVAAGVVFNGAAPLADPALLHISIGGLPATVLWAGMVAAGEYQFNVQIPALADGDQPIVANIAGVSTQNGLSIPVQN